MLPQLCRQETCSSNEFCYRSSISTVLKRKKKRESDSTMQQLFTNTSEKIEKAIESKFGLTHRRESNKLNAQLVAISGF